MPSKHALQSTTIQGILVMAIAYLLTTFLGVEAGVANAQTAQFVEGVSVALTAFGAIWAARGRKDAKTAINFLPKFGKGNDAPATTLTPGSSGKALFPDTPGGTNKTGE